MKSLSTTTQAAIDNPHVDPVRLLTIELPGLTLRLCDRVFGVSGSEFVYDGEIYEPLVFSWDTIEHGRIDPEGNYTSEPAEFGATLDNSVPVGGADRLSDLFAVHDPAFAVVTVSEFYSRMATAADAVTFFEGELEDLTGITTDQVAITAMGFESSLSNRFSYSILKKETYPGADPDDINKMIPQAWGPVRKVRALSADAGGKSTIVAAMTTTSPGDGDPLEISDGSFFPDGAFVLQIDTEQISIASKSGNILTLAAAGARGYNSTDVVEHDAGAGCAEVKSSYVWIFADHPVSSADAVYVDNVRQTSGFTVYTGQSGDELAGYEGKAVVSFSVLPTFEKQINVAISDTIGIDDTLSVDDGIGISDTLGVSQGSHSHQSDEQIVTWNFESGAKVTGTVYNPASICDGDLSTMASFDYMDSQVKVEKAYYESFDGAPSQIRLCMATADIGTSVTMRFTFCGETLNATADNDIVKGSWQTLGSSYNTWAEINAAVGYVTQKYSNNSSYVFEVWAEIKYTPEVTASPATGVARVGSVTKSGTATINGTVTKTGTVSISGNSTAEVVIGSQINVDFTGRVDEALGTYTGTAGAVIERPDHIARHILMGCCGLAAARIGNSYTTSGLAFEVRDFRLGVVLTQKPDVRALLSRIAFQSQSIDFWESGQHQIKFIAVVSTVVKQIDQHRVDLNQVYLKSTDRSGIVNTLDASYHRDWSGASDNSESDRETVSGSNAASVAKYGSLVGETLSMPYIVDESQAAAVLAWVLGEKSTPRYIVELSGGYFLADIERGDVVAFEADAFADVDYLDRALLGLVSDSSRFRVIDKTNRNDAAIQLEMITIDQFQDVWSNSDDWGGSDLWGF